MMQRTIIYKSNDLRQKKRRCCIYCLTIMEKYDSNVKIAYYDAEKNDKITTESLIAGLNWMIDNKVNCVCISLSSAYYSEELETWINKHHEEITIYASYSNLYNTVDYLAPMQMVSDKRKENIYGKD